MPPDDPSVQHLVALAVTPRPLIHSLTHAPLNHTPDDTS